MYCFNKRLNRKAKVSSINFTENLIELIDNGYIYKEKLENVILLEDTGVVLDDVSVYVNDIVTDGKKEYKVQKVPGGYFPFMLPNKQNFRKVNGMQ